AGAESSAPVAAYATLDDAHVLRRDHVVEFELVRRDRERLRRRRLYAEEFDCLAEGAAAVRPRSSRRRGRAVDGTLRPIRGRLPRRASDTAAARSSPCDRGRRGGGWRVRDVRRVTLVAVASAP